MDSSNDNDLFSNTPDENYVSDEEAKLQRTRGRQAFFFYAGMILALFLAVCLIAVVAFPAAQRDSALKTFLPFLSTATPTPLFADSPSDYFATATAFPNVQGSFSFRDEFNASEDNWCEGDDDDSWSTNSFKIADGKYSWSVKAKRDMFLRCTLDDAITLPDQFYLAVTAAVTGAEDSQAALIFHKSDAANYYVFSVYPVSQAFDVYIYLDEKWIELIPYTESTAINSTETNRMAVLADGPRYIFFINGQYAGKVEDDRLSAGTAGLGISLSEGASSDFVFDDFEVKYP